MSLPTPEEVQTDVDAWLDDNWDPAATVAEWWQRLADAAYAKPSLPAEAGGRGWGRAQMGAFNRVLVDRGVLGAPNGLGIMLAAPTIAAHGTPEQIDRHLPQILNGQHSWCQLFSEPNAGSDLAGLQTRAERDGDEWVITGQKVWTSGGHTAQRGMLIARTDAEQPKHRGITYFAFDMDQPGIEVRPLREMTGRAMFNEVFIDGARVHDDDRIGELNGGWAVANTTLAVERASLGSSGPSPFTAVPGPVVNALAQPAGEVYAKLADNPAARTGLTVPDLIELARKLGRSDDPVIRQDLARLHSMVEVNKLTMLRAKTGDAAGAANIGKLAVSQQLRHMREVGNQIIGADGMLAGHSSPFGGGVQEVTLFSPGPSIYGGTDEVQRNILGERVLGLPKEPGPGRDTPFRDLPANQ